MKYISRYINVISLREVAVIGGGFVGSFTSWQLARKGINVTLFEEHDEIGYPPHCTGLVSISGLQRLGIYDLLKRQGAILNKIRSATFMTSSGRRFIAELPEPIAVIVDRPALDRIIASKAIDNGVEVNLRTRVTHVSPSGELRALSGDNGLVKRRYKVIVDAEGPARLLIRGLPGVNMKGLLPAFQQDIRGESNRFLDTSSVLVYFNLPDFFSWIVPIDNSGRKWRIGLASRQYSSKLLAVAKSLTRTFFKNISTIRRFGGIVVSGGPIKKFVWGKIAAVGDAAGQVKPTTGGGVTFGGLSALILSRVIQLHLDFEAPLQYYESIWRKLFRTNFQAMLLIRRIYNMLTHAGIDALARFIPRNILNNFKTDFDFQLEGILSKLR